jgi:flagellar basal body-associated protein FliL
MFLVKVNLMKNKLKVIFIIIIVFLVLFVVGKYLLDTLFGDMCGNEIVQKVPSPSGEQVAYIFTRDCGATTGISPQLSILDGNDTFQNTSGNTFRSDKEFSIKWLSDKKLQVIYKRKSETYEMDKNVNGIKIDYVGK